MSLLNKTIFYVITFFSENFHLYNHIYTSLLEIVLMYPTILFCKWGSWFQFFFSLRIDVHMVFQGSSNN